MDAEDLGFAFESHATSKIKNEKDLHNIATLGFQGRGPGKCCSSRTGEGYKQSKRISLSGYCIEYRLRRQRRESTQCSADYGTTIQVRDLFYKLPARRKFLKTANTEMSHIIETFTRIALPNEQYRYDFVVK